MAVTVREAGATSENFAASTAGAASKAMPDPRFARPDCLFFGIGSEKCGTSWLNQFLSGHPEVHVPRYQKELHYWSSGHRGKKIPWLLEKQMPRGPVMSFWGSVLRPGRNLRRFRRNLFLQKWWKAFTVPSPTHSIYCDVLFTGYRKEKVAGEITPAYARCTAGTFAEMAALAPDVRFIFIMRDPVARLWSGCRHRLRIELGQQNTTTQAVSDRVLSSLAESETGPLRLSSYNRTIQTLESVVAAERIAYFFYETLFQQSEIERLCAFLDVESPAAIDKAVHVGADASGEMPPEVARKAREALAPTNDFCRAKFGTLPPEWQDKTVVGDA
ncbi:sulfotransferase [Roseovarius sp. D22-M7]|uniref:sulfotransferase n=1 Tax=Roseovarius sp. D22-M7 TaxID=3127116 RepID=UPI00300F997D